MKHNYNYTTEQEIIDHLGMDLQRMKYSITQNGYVCQEQYEKLDACLCDGYASRIVKILADETGRNIGYAHSVLSFYVFFAREEVEEEYAIEKADEWRHYLYG